MAQQLIELHASSLSDYGDCARRAAAKLFKNQIGKVYNLADYRRSVGIPIGNTLHKLMAELFRIKLVIGHIDESDIETALAAVWDTFTDDCAEGVIWDKKGPTMHEEHAREQLKNMAIALLPVAQYTNPAKIEHTWEWKVSPLGKLAVPVKIKGTIDLLTTRGEIQDHKCGKEFPSVYAQLGLYALLGEYNGEDITGARVNFVPRKPISKQYEVVVRSVALDLDECKAAAWTAIKEFQRHYEDYLATNDPHSFPSNPVSYLCSSNYCLAHGTGWCGVGNSEEG